MVIRLISRHVSPLSQFMIKGLGLTLLIVVWHISSTYTHEVILPSPLEAINNIAVLFTDYNALEELKITTIRALTGFVICVLIAGTLGLISGFLPFVRALLCPIERIMLSVPPVAWTVLTILWFGTSGLGSVVTTIVISQFPLLYISTLQGVKTIDTKLLDMGRSFGMSHAKSVLTIGSMHTLSMTFSSLTISFGQSWKVGIMAEVLGAQNGIGSQIRAAQAYLETTDVFSWIVIAVTLFIITDKIFIDPINKYTMKWR